jgi:hypothetical protein
VLLARPRLTSEALAEGLSDKQGRENRPGCGTGKKSERDPDYIFAVRKLVPRKAASTLIFIYTIEHFPRGPNVIVAHGADLSVNRGLAVSVQPDDQGD